MHAPRYTNATLFVTVLSACLGLVIAGVPAQIQAQQVAVETVGESQSASGVPQGPGATPEVEKLFNRGVFSRPFIGFVTKLSKLIAKGALDWNNSQARKLAADYNFMFLVGMCRESGEPAEIFYQNTQALTDNDQVLIVTRLPRAGLAVPLVEKPAAN